MLHEDTLHQEVRPLQLRDYVGDKKQVATITVEDIEGWLETNILNGTLNLPAAKLEKFNAPDWKPRRWAWVDPEKDINAQIKAVENHFKSKRQVIAESGGDIEDVYKDIKRDEELAEDVGLEKPENESN